MEQILIQPKQQETNSIWAAPESFVFYANAEVVNFVFRHMNVFEQFTGTTASSPDSPPSTATLSPQEYHIDMTPIIPVTRLDDRYAEINRQLEVGGYYVGCFEDYTNRRKRFYQQYDSVVATLQLAWEFVFRNLFPRWNPHYMLYKYLNFPRRSSISLAEALGRLANAGFEIQNYRNVGYLTYFVSRKRYSPKGMGKGSSGIITRLKRIGKAGKIIDVFKVRSMYPFSEYLHDYVVQMNGYNKIGKPENDFRLTPFGKFIRKCWIDELPQLFNLLKGDIRLVGVRPISVSGFNALPDDLRRKRILYKPGLIPPHVALRYKGFDGVIRAERKYLDDKQRLGWRCDIWYFFRAVFNILSLRAASA